eukprot:784182-Ditylum_brightwellii.AAC.1
MSTYFMPYCNGNSLPMTPCLNEGHLINNILSEQLEATQKQDRDISVEIADFDTSKSSASHLPLNFAETTSTNEAVMSESECSSLHYTNSICLSALDGVESLCQLCSPMSVVSEYYLTKSSTNNLSNPYSLENKQ